MYTVFDYLVGISWPQQVYEASGIKYLAVDICTYQEGIPKDRILRKPGL